MAQDYWYIKENIQTVNDILNNLSREYIQEINLLSML